METGERSELVMIIMGKTPPGIIRWGSFFYLVFLLSIIAISFVIEYPDTIPAQIEVTTSIPPATVHAMASGNISRLFVVDNQAVRKGDTLALIENSAEYSDIIILKKGINGSCKDSSALCQLKHLGEIQNDYNLFVSSLKDLELFKKLDSHHKRIEELKNKLDNHALLLGHIKNQYRTTQNEYSVLKKKFQRDSILYHSNNAISEDAYNNTYLNLLAKQNTIYSIDQEITNTVIQIDNIQELINELELSYTQENKSLSQQYRNNKHKVLSSICQWEKRYVLVAPISGTVSFFQLWSNNQFVQSGEGIFTIVPHENSTILGKILMPIKKSGEVKIGQRVNIKLESYPYQEYGFLIGKVSNMSLVPVNDLYAVEVEFPNGFKTTYKKEIAFMQKMNGTAEIIVKDAKLIERILYIFKDIIINKTA